MPDSLDRKFQGILREGWVAHVDDYALDCATVYSTVHSIMLVHHGLPM